MESRQQDNARVTNSELLVYSQTIPSRRHIEELDDWIRVQIPKWHAPSDCSRFCSAKVTIMCGRYRMTAKERYLRDHFGLDEDPSRLRAGTSLPHNRWQLSGASTQPRRIFLARGGSFLLGRIPRIRSKTINAMSERRRRNPHFAMLSDFVAA
jgi:hypothetical protein